MANSSDVDDRVAHFVTDLEELVMYDREEPERWIQSDVFVDPRDCI